MNCVFILITLLGQAQKTLFCILVCDSSYFLHKYKHKSSFQNKAHLLLPVKFIQTYQLHIINLSVGEPHGQLEPSLRPAIPNSGFFF